MRIVKGLKWIWSCIYIKIGSSQLLEFTQVSPQSNQRKEQEWGWITTQAEMIKNTISLMFSFIFLLRTPFHSFLPCLTCFFLIFLSSYYDFTSPPPFPQKWGRGWGVYIGDRNESKRDWRHMGSPFPPLLFVAENKKGEILTTSITDRGRCGRSAWLEQNHNLRNLFSSLPSRTFLWCYFCFVCFFFLSLALFFVLFCLFF